MPIGQVAGCLWEGTLRGVRSDLSDTTGRRIRQLPIRDADLAGRT